MSGLAAWTLGLALVLLVLHGTLVIAPARAAKVAAAFPRHKWAGRVLASVALLWAAWVIKDMPLGRFEYLKQWLYIAAPVTIGLTCVWMEELLAPRALGGILLLCPAPILLLARMHDSPWSVVMSVVAYIMAIKGIALLLSPYLFRKGAQKILASDARCRTLGGIGVAVDVFLLALALFVY